MQVSDIVNGETGNGVSIEGFRFSNIQKKDGKKGPYWSFGMCVDKDAGTWVNGLSFTDISSYKGKTCDLKNAAVETFNDKPSIKISQFTEIHGGGAVTTTSNRTSYTLEDIAQLTDWFLDRHTKRLDNSALALAATKSMACAMVQGLKAPDGVQFTDADSIPF